MKLQDYRKEFTEESNKLAVLDSLWFDHTKLIGLDIETGNLLTRKGENNPWNPNARIGLVQMCHKGEIKLYDWNKETIDKIQWYIDNGYTFIAHNAEFELTWLRKFGNIRINHILDTMVFSQVINAGKQLPDEGTFYSMRAEGLSVEHVGRYEMLIEEDENNLEEEESGGGGRLRHNLAAVAYRYARAKLKKDSAMSDWLQRPLTKDQIRYASEDVEFLERIVLNQLYYAHKYGMLDVLKLEAYTTPCISEMRYNGLLLDKQRWEESAHENEVKATALKEELDKLYGIELGERNVINAEEFDFFGVVQQSFNVGSDTQLKKFYTIEKADEQALLHISHPLIKSTLEFKTFKKLASTYGTGYTQYIAEDGRVHSPLTQAKTATGRLSSDKPNLQNIPGDILKKFILAAHGYMLMTADYSSVESRILAYDADDEQFIKTVNSSDLHWSTAIKVFKLPEDMPVDAELRRGAKGVNFGIPYGLSAAGLVNRGYVKTKEEGEELINSWFAAFPMVKSYLAKSIQEATQRGYTQDRLGRIRWYEIPDKRNVDEQTYKSILSAAARQGQNMKIQALSASVTKQAIVDCTNYLNETGYGYCVLTVHDSIFFELKEEYAHIAAPMLQKIMEDAGKKIIPGINTPVDFDLGTVEERKCKVSNLKFKVYSHVYDKEQQVVKPNVETIAPETKKCLKNMGIELSDDYMGMFVEAMKRLPTRDEQWREDNKKWVKAMESVQALSA